IGGVELDPTLLSPLGLDVAAPIVVSLFDVQPGGKAYRHRAVATLRDPSLFRAFLGAVAASGQAPLERVDAGSAAGRLGVLASAKLPDGATAIARISGEWLIIDAVGANG